MDNFVSSCIGFLYEAFVECIGCTVARLVFPLLSLGRVYVKPFNSPPQRFNWLGYRRDESGRIELDDSVAGVMGLFVVFIVLLAITLIFRLSF